MSGRKLSTWQGSTGTSDNSPWIDISAFLLLSGRVFSGKPMILQSGLLGNGAFTTSESAELGKLPANIK